MQHNNKVTTDVGSGDFGKQERVLEKINWILLAVCSYLARRDPSKVSVASVILVNTHLLKAEEW